MFNSNDSLSWKLKFWKDKQTIQFNKLIMKGMTLVIANVASDYDKFISVYC